MHATFRHCPVDSENLVDTAKIYLKNKERKKSHISSIYFATRIQQLSVINLHHSVPEADPLSETSLNDFQLLVHDRFHPWGWDECVQTDGVKGRDNSVRS